MIIAVIITFMAFLIRLVIVKYIAAFSLRQFFCKTVLPVTEVSLCSWIFPVIISSYLQTGFLRLIATTLISCLSPGLFIWGLGLSGEERKMLSSVIRKKLHA